jgi:hypothetical protein
LEPAGGVTIFLTTSVVGLRLAISLEVEGFLAAILFFELATGLTPNKFKS